MVHGFLNLPFPVLGRVPIMGHLRVRRRDQLGKPFECFDAREALAPNKAGFKKNAFNASLPPTVQRAQVRTAGETLQASRKESSVSVRRSIDMIWKVLALRFATVC